MKSQTSGAGSVIPKAFTLIEMLVVITIIALLLALGVPQVVGTLRASRLTGAGDKVLGVLADSQQTAFSQNYTVEVRFYKSKGDVGGEVGFRKIQQFKVSVPPNTNTEEVSKIGMGVRIPDGVFISANARLSPLLSGPTTADTKKDSGIEGAEYVAMRFLTDGTFRKVESGNLGLAVMTFPNMADSYMTVVDEDGKSDSASGVPPNFYTVQIDPYTGKSRSYRPGF